MPSRRAAFARWVWHFCAVPYTQSRRKPTTACPKLARLLSCLLIWLPDFRSFRPLHLPPMTSKRYLFADIAKGSGEMAMENWIQTDEAADVAGSVRHAIRAAQFVCEDPLAWKWVAMALHSALQGACVCHLTTTAAPVGAVTERNAGEWLTYFEESRTDPKAKPPKTYLMALPELLKAVRKPPSAGDGSNDVGVAISESELHWLRRFHMEIRNQFAHFEPKGWSIEVSGVPDIAKLIARVIGDILQIGWAFRHHDSAQRQELRGSLNTIGTMDWPQ